MSTVQNEGSKKSSFPETRWSLIVRAQGQSPDAQKALEDLCQTYWYPLYGFARFWGLNPQDAEDSTQGFFQRLLANRTIDKVAEDRGKLRAFLLASMKNFLASSSRDQKALKRGGGQALLSIDQDWAEGTLGDTLADKNEAPEATFDRHWAFSLLNSVSRRLEAHYEKIGKRELYEAIKGCLEGDGTYETGEALAARLGISHESVRSAVFKLRRRFREYVEEAIRDTCADESEVKDEISHLCRILAN